MKWTLGILTVLLVAVVAATGPSQDLKASASTNMSQEGKSEPITIESTTQNLFGDVVAITPPNSESIELRHLNDDTRFFPDYGDRDHVDGQHFTETPSTRTKRQSIDYKDLDYETYLDSSYTRRRRQSEGEPLRIELNIPGDLDSQSTDSSEVSTPESDPESVSTQVTYLIISDDDTPEDGTEERTTEQQNTGREVHATQVIDLDIPSSEQGTTSDSSASTDSFVGRNRVLRAIANTIRSKSRSSKVEQSRLGSVNSEPSTSDDRLPSRKKRQNQSYGLPEFLNYRVGRSVSESDTDDKEPEESRGHNVKDLPDDRVKRSGRVTPLPEYSYEFSELTRPSSTYVDGQLRNYFVPERRKSKRSAPSESTTQKSEGGSTREPDLDVVTASYPLGIDATKDNLSLPEGNFLGPRIYAQGGLVQEEQPAIVGIAVPMEKEKSVPVLNGAKTDTVYSAPVNSVNLPLVIPVVGPTSLPGEGPRIELSVPSGYVPYIIQLEPRKNRTSGKQDVPAESRNSNLIKETATLPLKQEVPTPLPFVPTIIITPSTPISGYEVSTQTEIPTTLGETKSLEAVAAQEVGSSRTPATTKLELPSNLRKNEAESGSKQKRGWKDVSNAPAGEVEQPRQQTAKWAPASKTATSDLQMSRSTSSWKSVPIGDEELPRQPTAKWEPLSNAPDGEVQVVLQGQTARWESASTLPTGAAVQSETATWKSASRAPAGEEEITKQHTASWKSVPMGEEELPKQNTARWEAISNAPAGESTTSTLGTGNGNIQQAASGAPVGKSSLQQSAVVPRSQKTFDSEMSDQAPPARRERLWASKGNQVVPILEKNSFLSSNGSFSYSYKSGNGIQVEESGYLKKEPGQKGSTDGEVAQTVQGSYSYPSSDGRTIRVRYVADENGFRPEVEDLPK